MTIKNRVRVETAFATPWKPENAGQELSGQYMGSELVPSQDARKAPFVAYQILADDGVTYSVTGAILARAFEIIPTGTRVDIVFNGMSKTKKGNSQKEFDVYTSPDVKLLSRDATKGGTIDPHTGETFA